MNPVREALYDALVAVDALGELLPTEEVADSIHHRRAPQNAEPPYVIYHRHLGPRRWTFQDFTRWDLWFIKAISREGGSAPAEAIFAAIDAALSDAQLEIEGNRHLHLRCEQEEDYGEDRGGETWHYVGGLYRLVTQPN